MPRVAIFGSTLTSPLFATLLAASLMPACDPPPPEPSPTRDPARLPGVTAQTTATPTAAPKAKGPFPESKHAALKDPSKAKETAPDRFAAEFDTTAGKFTINCERGWAPHGVDRLYNLIKIGFYQDVAFFRVVPGFVAQFGIHGNPEVSKHWRNANIPADGVEKKNRRGTVTFAMAGKPTTRATQLFINFKDNTNLDKMGFAPICSVSKGMDVVDAIYSGYGSKAGADQTNIQFKGNAYLRATYPALDYIKTVTFVDAPAPDSSASADASAGPAPSAKPNMGGASVVLPGDTRKAAASAKPPVTTRAPATPAPTPRPAKTAEPTPKANPKAPAPTPPKSEPAKYPSGSSPKGSR